MNFTFATCQLCANGNLDIFAAENSLTSTEWGVTVSNAPGLPRHAQRGGRFLRYRRDSHLHGFRRAAQRHLYGLYQGRKGTRRPCYALESDSDLVWTAITDEGRRRDRLHRNRDSRVLCPAEDKRENVEGEVVLDEENSYPATEEEDGKNVYNATFTVTDESGKVLGTYSAQKEDILDAPEQKVHRPCARMTTVSGVTTPMVCLTAARTASSCTATTPGSM